MRTRTTAVIVAACTAALATATTALGATPLDGSWTGTTSQADSNGVPGTVSFKVSKNGRKIKQFKWQELTKCDSGQTFTSTNTTRSLKVSKKGHVDVLGGFTSDAGNGYTAQHGATLHGRFTSKHVFKAKFEDVIAIFDSSMNQVDTCHSGTVKVTAKRH